MSNNREPRISFTFNNEERDMTISEYYEWCKEFSRRAISSGDKELIRKAIRNFDRMLYSGKFKSFRDIHHLVIKNEIKSLLRLMPRDVIPTQHYKNGGTTESWYSTSDFKGYSPRGMIDNYGIRMLEEYGMLEHYGIRRV